MTKTESDLFDATHEFFDEDDVESVSYSPDRDAGSVVVAVEETDAGFTGGVGKFDVEDFDDHLRDAGFEYTGYVPAPEMTQVNVRAADGDGA